MKRIFVLICVLLIAFCATSCGRDYISCFGDNEIKLNGKDIINDNPYNRKNLGVGVDYVIFRGGSIEGEDSGAVTKIESWEDVDKFIKVNKLYTLDGYQFNRVENFEPYVRTLDENFFDDNVLIVVNIVSGSGSTRYYATGYDTLEENSLTLGISTVMTPPNTDGTSDMASWHMVFEFDRSFLEGIEKIIAVDKTHYTCYALDSDEFNAEIWLDQNNHTVFFSYGKYLGSTHGGTFESSVSKMILNLDDDKLVFDVGGDAFERLIYNKYKSSSDLGVIENGAIFKLRK